MIKDKPNGKVVSKPIKPPFSALSSFLPTAMILSFYGYTHITWVLLQKLSSNSRKYSFKHRDTLFGFLVNYESPRKHTLMKGASFLPTLMSSVCYFEWPTEAQHK